MEPESVANPNQGKARRLKPKHGCNSTRRVICRSLILVFGTICLDRVRLVPFLPGSGGYVEAVEERLMLGGEAANTAFALRAWGAEVELAGNSLGSGGDAETLTELVKRHGLPDGLLARGGASAPICDVYVTPDGERTMFGRGFSTMEPAQDPEALPYRPGEWFTAEPNMADAARQAARAAHKSGMQTYLMDFFQPDDPIPEGGFWQSSTDWVGARADEEANLAWVRAWIEAKGCFAIVTDGSRGLAAGSPDHEPRWYPAFRAPVVRDSTGAGDFFRAGMLCGLDQDWPLSDCLRYASAAGALACSTVGATGGAPSVEEIRDFIGSQPEVAAAFGSLD